MDPKGKVALLTAGTRIGQVVAQSLAVRGCSLALIHRGSRQAAEVKAYMHNGYFKSLNEVVHFYNTRDRLPR